MMKRGLLRWLVTMAFGVLAACAIITVNVYFPEKDVKDAYKSLDDMLLRQGEGAKEPGQEAPPDVTPEKKEEIKPQSGLLGQRFAISFVTPACAAEEVADELAIELSSMPEVLKAYDEIRATIPQMRALRDAGAVGEGKQGLLVVRDKTKLGGNDALVKQVNESRKTIITGMAKAILKVNKQPVTTAGINQVLGKAAATYAETRRDKAKPGWWIELPNGRWVQK